MATESSYEAILGKPQTMDRLNPEFSRSSDSPSRSTSESTCKDLFHIVRNGSQSVLAVSLQSSIILYRNPYMRSPQHVSIQAFKKAVRKCIKLQNSSGSENQRKLRAVQRKLNKLYRVLNPLGRKSLHAALSLVATSAVASAGVLSDAVTVVESSPAPNDVGSVFSSIDMGFSKAVSTNSVTAANISVFGSQTGKHSWLGALLSGSTQATLAVSNANFVPGERITVGVRNVHSTNGTAMSSSHSWSFFPKTTKVNNAFSHEFIEDFDELFLGSVGDIDGDGDLDIIGKNSVYAVFGDDNKLAINDGAGNFTVATLTAYSFISVPHLADVDGDGDLDLIEMGFDGLGGVSINDGDSFVPTQALYAAGYSYRTPTFADIDNDGDIDISLPLFLPPGQTAIFKNDGTGSFTSSTVQIAEVYYQDHRYVDVDGDGDIDIVTAGLENDSYKAVTITFNNGDAPSTQASFGADMIASKLVIGDFDNDGDNDVFVGGFITDALDNEYSSGMILLNDGNGNFSEHQRLQDGYFFPFEPTPLEPVDIDGDGDLDIVSNSQLEFGYDGEFVTPVVWLNDGTGTFHSKVLPRKFGDRVNTIKLGDIDGDGSIDIIASSFEGETEVLFNNPTDPKISLVQPLSIPAGETSAVQIKGDHFEHRTIKQKWFSLADDISEADVDGAFVADLQAQAAVSEVSIAQPSNSISIELAPSTAGTIAVLVDNGFGEEVVLLTVHDNSMNYPTMQPPQFTHSVSTTGGVLLQFPESMDMGGIEGGRLALHSNMTGSMTTRAQLSISSSTVHVAFDRDFYPNEEVYITVTSATSVAGSVVESSQVLQFRTAPSTGYGWFESSSYGNESNRDIAIGDFDQDGDIDVAAAAYDDDEVALFWNDGTGSFSEDDIHDSYFGGVAAADVDNDGDLDLLFTNNYAGTDDEVPLGPESKKVKIELWINDGTGSFTINRLGLPFEFTTKMSGVDFADLDGDGDQDAIIAKENMPFLMRNCGDGSFDVETPFPEQENIEGWEAHLVDLNNDGAVDVVFGSSVGDGDIPTQVWQNNGDATFVQHEIPAVEAYRIKSADFDGNGYADLVCASLGNEFPSSILFNQGNFEFEAVYIAPEGARGVGVGDFDADGSQDIILGLGDAPDMILLNDGTGSFKTHYTDASEWSRDMEVADLNGDGALDIVMGLSSGDGLGVLINTPTTHLASFSPTTAATVSEAREYSFIFSGEMDPSTLTAGTIQIRGSLSGLLSSNATFTVNPSTSAVAVTLTRNPIVAERISIYGDGFEDADDNSLYNTLSHYIDVVATTGSTRIFNRDVKTGHDASRIAAGDIDGDGVADVVTIGADGDVHIHVYDVNTGTTNTTSIDPGVTPLDVITGDLNNDGRVDIVVISTGNDGAVLRNDGNLSFAISTFYHATIAKTGSCLADVNFDGKLDLLLSKIGGIGVHEGGAGVTFSHQVKPFMSGLVDFIHDHSIALPMNANSDAITDVIGAGNEGIVIRYGTADAGYEDKLLLSDFSTESNDAIALAVGDLNSDGIDDIIASNRIDETLLYLSDGEMTFTPTTFATVGYNMFDMADVTGDGLIDIVAADDETGYILANDGAGNLSTVATVSVDARGLVVCDYDGDSDVDVVAITDDDALQVWFNNPQAPYITSLEPNGTTASVHGAALSIEGFVNWGASAELGTLDGTGSEVGNYELVSTQSTTTTLQAVALEQSFATVGTITLTISDFVGSTTTTLTVVESLYGRHDYSAATGARTIDVQQNDIAGGTVVLDAGQPDWGTVSVTSNGIVYTPNAGFYGVDVFTYTFGFPTGVSSSATVTAYTNPGGATERNLTQLQMVEQGGSIAALKKPRGAAVSSDGQHVYVGAYTSKAVTHFTRSSTGSLTYVGEVSGNGQGLASLTQVVLSPDGKFLYTTSRSEYAVGIYSVSTTTGVLTYVDKVERNVDGVDGLKNVEDIAISPDGKHVYTVSSSDHKLTVFKRDETTGLLTYIERFKDGVDGVTKMRLPRAVTVSLDGNNVYVAAYSDNAVNVFSRDEDSGELTFIEHLKEGSGGIDGLTGASGVAVSPDGEQVFVSGYRDNSLVVFARTTTGSLTYDERFKSGKNGVEQTSGAYQLRVAPTGQHIAVGAKAANAAALFGRNSVSGEVEYDEFAKRNTNGVTGLYQPINVAFDPESQNLYVMGTYSNSVTVFEMSEIVPVKRGEDNRVQSQRLPVSIANVYPLPATDEVVVDFADRVHIQGYEVYDAAGRVLVADKSESSISELKLHTHTLPSGHYFIRFLQSELDATQDLTVEFVVVR